MIKRDYSRPAFLLMEERYDYDTNSFNETGINDDRAQLPERYEIESLKSEFLEDFDWQITYSFPKDRRVPKGYGGKNVTFRRLYLILGERFEGGYFIDTYFERVYPYTMKQRVDAVLQEAKEQLLEYADTIIIDNIPLTKAGNFNKRFSATKALNEANYFSFKEKWEESTGKQLAKEIKDDIIACLANGVIPIRHINQAKTFRLRHSLGLDDAHVFFASGQLVRSIKLFFNVGGTGKWQTIHPATLV